jgi:predicted ferric reductase
MKNLKVAGLYALLLLNPALILWGWWTGSHGLFSSDLAGLLLAFGRLSGLLAVFCVLLEFVLIGRPVWLERVFGFDKLANWHHLNGFLALFFIAVHPVLLGFSYAIDAKITFWAQLVDFFQNFQGVNQAVFSVFLFAAVVMLSVQLIKRRLKYETWLVVHLFIYLAVILAFAHQLQVGGDFLSNKTFTWCWIVLYWLVFGNFIVFRFIKPLYDFFRQDFRVERLVQETADTWSIYISGKHLEKLRIRPGQFMTFRFLDRKRCWQAHPFSVSGAVKNKIFRITVKKLGDSTRAIDGLKKGTKVLIEGPFGTFTLSDRPKQKLLFIAGGVGITPIMSLLHQAAPDNDAILLYGSKTGNDIIFKEELRILSDKYPVKIHHVLSNEENYQGEKGRIDAAKLQKLVADLKERHIYMCGPKEMTDSLCKFLDQASVPREQVHYEKFVF